MKKAFEFPKNKTKDTSAKEVVAKEPVAPVEDAPAPVPVAEAEAAAPAAAVAAEPAVESAPPAPETKPTVAGKLSEKVSEGKGFFNKVKKSFFTKSHSFSGSIPDSKAAVGAPPATIPEAPKEAETAPAPATEATEVRAIFFVLLNCTSVLMSQ